MIPISPTSLSKMEACPRHWKAVYVDKTSDFGNKATYAGEAEHKKYEDAIKAGGLPDDKFAANIIAHLRGLGGKVEAEKWLSVDRENRYAPYGVNPYIRCKADILATYDDGKKIYIGDWKTGKWVPKTESDVDYTQLQINAIAALGMKPKAEKATVALIYTAGKKVFPLTVKRSDITTPSPEFKKLYVRFQKYEQQQGAEHFEATPCRMCSFCPVATCQHHPGYDG